MGVSTAHGCSKQGCGLIEKGALTDGTIFHLCKGIADATQDTSLQHHQLFNFFGLLSVMRQIVVVPTEFGFFKTFPKRNLNRNRTGGIAFQGKHRKVE